MSWDRSSCAAALAAQIQTQVGETIFVFAKPPTTLNPPCIVVGRPNEVRFTQFAFGVDEADLPVLCVGPADGDDVVASMIASVRAAVNADLTLGGTVAAVGDSFERNWRNINVAGIDLLQAEVTLTVQM